MKVADFNYFLPPAQIADFPPEIRGASRLLVLHRNTGEIEHKRYPDLVDYLNPGDVLILNDTKVIKARLLADTKLGAQKEIFLLEKHSTDSNDTHVHNAIYRGALHVNDILTVGNANIIVSEIRDDGTITIKSDTDLEKLADSIGHTPLPPYIKREDIKEDVERYQTVFAREKGSVAAPTASLNMTEELLEKIRAKGIKICYLTLHVGLGTFSPIKVDNLSEHKMHSEYFIIPAETVSAIQQAKKNNSSVVALGTTVTRALEYSKEKILYEPPQTVSGEADIFIYPGYQFGVVDKLVTNYHAPRSTVLMLTAAFAGWDKLKPAYESAIASGYSFLSYGDSMLIL